MPALRHWIILGLLVVFYGSAFILIKQALTALSPETIVLGRLVTGFLILAPIAFIMGLRVPTDPRVLKGLTVLAVLGYALPFSLIAWGQQVVPSGVAGILMAIMPIAIIGLAHLFIADEPLTRRKMAGFALAFGGTFVLIGPDAFTSLGGDASMLLHQLAVLAGALSYSAGAVATRRAAPVDAIAGSTLVMLVATLLTLPFALPEAIAEIRAAPWPALTAVALLGAFPTAAAAILFYILIREAGPSFFAITNYLVPVWAALLGTTLGMEPLGAQALAGLALVLAGVALAQVRPAPSATTASASARDDGGRA